MEESMFKLFFLILITVVISVSAQWTNVDKQINGAYVYCVAYADTRAMLAATSAGIYICPIGPAGPTTWRLYREYSKEITKVTSLVVIGNFMVLTSNGHVYSYKWQ
jgi:hypothetical protein